METPIQKKILLGLDGSERAIEAVRYLSKIPSFRKTQVVLFNVFSKISEAYWDLEKGSDLGWRIKDVRAWEVHREETIKRSMEQARQLLLEAGFPEDSIEIKIKEKTRGIARDIVEEAKQGYSAVVIGRRGMSKLKDLVLGSITTKLLEKISFAPLLLIGKNSSPEKVIVALDGSDNSMRSVNYVAETLRGSNFLVNLIHVIRAGEKPLVDEARRMIDSEIKEAKRRLETAGFGPGQIETQIFAGKESRAGVIVDEARKGGYGTIVMGRRGLSEVEEFSMGRVTNKVVYLAKGLATWVTN